LPNRRSLSKEPGFMSNQNRRLISLICLLAYLLASAPGYVTSAFSVARDSACCEGAAVCCSAQNQADQESCPAHGCEGVRGKAQPNGTVVAAPCGHQKQVPGLPCDSACPDGCYLCNAVGSVPSTSIPPVVIQSGVYIGAVSLASPLQVEQPYLGNLIRPPIC